MRYLMKNTAYTQHRHIAYIIQIEQPHNTYPHTHTSHIPAHTHGTHSAHNSAQVSTQLTFTHVYQQTSAQKHTHTQYTYTYTHRANTNIQHVSTHKLHTPNTTNTHTVW